MKKRKLYGNIYFILLLLLVSTIGIGFSSWLIGDNNINGDSGNVSVAIGTYNDAISINTKKGDNGVFPYTFCDKGLLNNTSYIENGLLKGESYAEITICLNVDVVKAKKYLDNYTNKNAAKIIGDIEYDGSFNFDYVNFIYLNTSDGKGTDGIYNSINGIKHFSLIHNTLLLYKDVYSLDLVFRFNVEATSLNRLLKDFNNNPVMKFQFGLEGINI